MTKEDLYKELLSLVVPREITQDFELKEIVEKTTMITLYFEELPDRRPKELEGKEVVLDGFVNQIELQTFPLKDKTVHIAVRRRRWKAKGDKSKSYSNSYDLHLEGMKTTKEFKDLLQSIRFSING
ncbi:MAG: hypothetical protein KKF98_00375 [Bacteroidetes bacterium]|nr:hypothetical protein [Bacteroidota bacterium]